MIEAGTQWQFMSELLSDKYYPSGGTAILVPTVGLDIEEASTRRRLVGEQPGLRESQTAIPRFLSRNAGRLVAFCNGEQTHSMVMHLLDKATDQQKVDLIGYTFDHPGIASAIIRAALRGTFVRLTLNDDEIGGRSSTKQAVHILRMITRACEDAGCGPDSPEGARTLEIRSQCGQRIAPVYRKWDRTLQRGGDPAQDLRTGALHAKMFAISPRVPTGVDEDSHVIILGSSNWTVSSEANQELNVVLEIGADGSSTASGVVSDIVRGSRQVSGQALRT